MCDGRRRRRSATFAVASPASLRGRVGVIGRKSIEEWCGTGRNGISEEDDCSELHFGESESEVDC